MSRKVVIIGAGISGLATAEALSRRANDAGVPVDVEVLEAGPHAGGKIRTSVEKGCVVETGPHGFLDKEPKIFELIDRLGIRDEMVPADHSSARRFVVRKQRLRELPSSPPSFLTSDILPLGGRLRILWEPFASGPPPGQDESVWDFAARRIGRQAADVLVDAMVTGIYGGDPKQLSLRSAFPRMHELESNYGSLVKAQFALARERRKQRQLTAGTSPQPAAGSAGAPAGTLHSFKRGLGTLTDALAERTAIRFEHPVQALQRSSGERRFAVQTPKGTIEADAVVLTTPT
ncbi:MAG: protoporphyrinogen oxidase, partial [Myxococcota bacterium]